MAEPLAPADDTFAEDLRAALPGGAVMRPDSHHLEEPRGRWAGVSQWVAAPRSTAEAAEIVRICAARRVGIIPYGGGTGLVGGQVSETALPLLVSMARMSAIRAVHPDENVLVAEAGAILAQVQDAAREAGRLFPLSLASEGSARIGGLLATNAGGVNVLRYGNARDLCLGLEAVLPDGQIWHGLKRLRKDNTGYDLRNLLIGAEGTLGLITAASLRLSPQPAATGTAVLALRDPAAALALLAMARDQVAEGLSAFELIGRTAFDFLSEAMPYLRQPFDTPPEWCVLIELGLAQDQDPQAALETLFERAMEAGTVSDGVIARSQAQADDFWAVRENIPAANRHVGSLGSHDISVPLGAIPDFIAQGQERLARLGAFRINCFGHVGDGNLHYNVFPDAGRGAADYGHLRDDIPRVVHDLVHEMDGSISAEHGIGRLKVDDLVRYGDPAKLSAMRAIKAALDPLGIMNPGAVLSPHPG